MNTQVRPDLTSFKTPGWVLQEAEKGEWLTSLETSWRSLSSLTEIGPACKVYLTRFPANLVLLGFPGEEILARIVSPAPAQYFSFDRYAAPLGAGEQQEPLWLYSVYGYLLGDQAVFLRYYATKELEFLALPRPVAFPW